MTKFTEDYMSEAEAATLLGVSRITLLRRRKRGEIEFYRIGSRVVYAKSQIQAFLDKCRRKSRA